MRVGDDRVAARHHAVVEPLTALRFAVGAVIGGDERHAGAPRGDQRAPGRRAAARVDEVDAVAAHDVGDAVRVPQEPDRALGGGGKELQLGAGVAQALHQPAALAQHDGASARALDRLGDLDGGKLRPAGVELGDDLQYGRALSATRLSPAAKGLFRMDETEPQFLDVGDGRGAAHRLSRRSRAGHPASLLLAVGLQVRHGEHQGEPRSRAFARAKGYGCTRFDYSGHGAPSGRFEDGTIGGWLEEAEAVFVG